MILSDFLRSIRPTEEEYESHLEEVEEEVAEGGDGVAVGSETDGSGRWDLARRRTAAAVWPARLSRKSRGLGRRSAPTGPV